MGSVSVRGSRAGVVLAGVVFVGCAVGIVVQVTRFFRAGGGGLEAVEVWKRDGLHALRARNAERLQHDSDRSPL